MKIDSSQTMSRTVKTDDVKAATSTVASAAVTGPAMAKVTDGFEVAKGGLVDGAKMIMPWPPISNVPLKDRNTAGSLHSTLSRPYNDFIMNSDYIPSQTLRRGSDGMVRGPDGQPLIETKLDDGKIAYVDPNTNQYYLAEKPRIILGGPLGGKGIVEGGCFPPFNPGIKVKGPLPLPKGAQFSNKYFTDNDVRQLTRDAKSHFHFQPFPGPKPLPGPFPFPRPLPIDVKPLPVELPIRMLGGAVKG